MNKKLILFLTSLSLAVTDVYKRQTIGFILCLGLYIVMKAEYYMENIVGMDFWALARGILKYYVIVLIVFAVISILFYGWKYADTQKLSLIHI